MMKNSRRYARAKNPHMHFTGPRRTPPCSPWRSSVCRHDRGSERRCSPVGQGRRGRRHRGDRPLRQNADERVTVWIGEVSAASVGRRV